MRRAKNVKLLEPINVDKIEIEKDHYFQGAYTIDLPIESTPDYIWQEIFDQEWRLSRRLWDRKIYVVGSKLRLVTSANNLKEKLEWVREIVKRTNKAVDEYNRGAEARAQATRRVMEKEKADIEMVRNTLR
jgi:hypothetical protein